MSKENTMAKLPGLFQRNGVWTLRVMIPLPLQASYGNRSKLIESLQTTDSAPAKIRGTARRAELLAEFGCTTRTSQGIKWRTREAPTFRASLLSGAAA